MHSAPCDVVHYAYLIMAFCMHKTKAINIEISTGDSRPIYKQIIDGIRLQISKGQLEPGMKLPSYRGLAMQLMINPNTVAKAYSELSSQGLVESRKGLGLFVVENQKKISDEQKTKILHEAMKKLFNEINYLNYSEEKILYEFKQLLKRNKKLLGVRHE